MTAAVTPSRYAAELLAELGLDCAATVATDTREEPQLWAASGAQYLTGAPDGPPLSSPAPLATCAQGAWLALAALSHGALDPGADAHQLLGERAALLGLQRQGAISAGGACRLLDCADGTLALNLPRDEDWELLPAWLEQPAASWEQIAELVQGRACDHMVARARLLGLAAAASNAPVHLKHWFYSHTLAPSVPPSGRRPLVVDLTALWAGPLSTQLLGQLGARVIKVESIARPDGARLGSPPFFDLLNAGKQSVALELRSEQGREQLRALLSCADIVVESTRPRALEHMGIHAADIVRNANGCVWLSLSGYGRESPMREWIAYGDDAGVAAGLSWLLRQSTGNNVFCADAIADPLTGLHAAVLAWAAWIRGGGVLMDVSLHGVVSRCIAAGGSTGDMTPASLARLPSARIVSGSAAPLGDHTTSVLSEFDIPT